MPNGDHGDTAVIYSPDIADLRDAIDTIDYTKRRGYLLLGIARKPIDGGVEHLLAIGVRVIVFVARTIGRPARSQHVLTEYAGDGPAVYETARLLPRGDDGGFGERFLRERPSGS